VAPVCPQCGGSLTIEPRGSVVEEYATPYHIVGEAVPTRERIAPLGCCNHCEFVIEIDARPATPEEARTIMRELFELTSAPAPLEDCPFTLTPPEAPRRPVGTQPTLFGGDDD